MNTQAPESTITTRLLRVTGKKLKYTNDLLAREEPLEIRVRDVKTTRTISITMRTPGEDELLALGFLYSEGIIKTIRQVAGVDAEQQRVTVVLAEDYTLPRNLGERLVMTSSACGVCSRTELKDLNLDGCEAMTSNDPCINESVLQSLPNLLRKDQSVFESTGGIHACGLFTPEGKRIAISEDIGRHNALDKLIGRQLANGRIPDAGNVLLLSGRIGFEMVQKAVRARIPVVLAIGAPSSLAVEVADRFGQTLVGFLKDDRYNLYTNPKRIALP